MELTFVGTGGGRFAMIKQLRQTGGFLVSAGDFEMYVDPGPGALVHGLKNGIDFENLEYIFCSHGHLDHCGDLEVILESITEGCNKDRGVLIASESVLGSEDFEPRLENYHLTCPEDRILAEEGEELRLEEVTLSFFETKHKDITTAGFKLETEDSSLVYVPDTELFDSIVGKIGSPDYLVLNVIRPYDKSWKGHLNLEDAVGIVKEVEPERAFFQHFGINFLYNFGDQKEWLDENYDKDNITLASDNKTYNLDGEGGLEKFV